MTTNAMNLPTRVDHQIPMLDLRRQYDSIRDEILEAVEDLFKKQQFILGPAVSQCEEQIAAYCNCRHGIGVSSGSDALLIALMAEDIGPGDEVITTPYSFFATAGCIDRVGARPVFVDISPDSYNIDVSQIENRITPETKAIIPVHLFGQCADMNPILDIANRHGLTVIEDAAQAIGAEYNGHRAGSMGHYGCFSFFPSKNLGAAGDAGMVVTQDADCADKLKVLRSHGSRPKYYHHIVGGNFRLDAIQAAVVQVKLRYLDRWTAARQRNAATYTLGLEQSGLVDRNLVIPPTVHPGRHIFNQYVVRVSKRDELQSYLKERGISTAIYYPLGLHEQKCFSDLGHKKQDFPETVKAAAETLALPVYPELENEQLEYVVNSICDFYNIYCG